jgi:head-tail adaptor
MGGTSTTKGQVEIVDPRASNCEKFRPRRHRITIDREVAIPRPWSTWARVCRCWAQIQDDVNGTLKVTIRYQKDLSLGMRVQLRNTYFQIVGVRDLPGTHRLTELYLGEFTPG